MRPAVSVWDRNAGRERARAREGTGEKRSSRAHAEANEASERYAESGARISPCLFPRLLASLPFLYSASLSL